MCLAIPMKVIAIDGFNARCEAKGVIRDASLFMLQMQDGNADGVAVGDFVTVHLGYVVQKVSEQEARTAWELFDQVLDTAHIPITGGGEYV
jgi:hydrogenase expression/formation protein HypC